MIGPHTQRTPDVSVIVLVKNGGTVCTETMRAILSQKLDRDVEVVVVDSGSSDGTPEAIERLFDDPATNQFHRVLRLHRIAPHNFNFSSTRNMAARVARGTLLVFLSSDATPTEDTWLAALLHPFGDERIAGTYSRQVSRPGAAMPERFALRTAYPSRSTVHTPDLLRRLNASSVLYSNAAGAIRRAIREEIPFDEQLVGCEDQHWAVATLQAGHRIAYVSEVRVEHSHHYTLGRIFTRAFDDGAGLAALPGGIGTESYLAYLWYLRREASYVLRNGGPSALPWVVAYEFCRSLGYLLGTNQRYLPLWLCRRISGFPCWYSAEARNRSTGVSSPPSSNCVKSTPTAGGGMNVDSSSRGRV